MQNAPNAANRQSTPDTGFRDTRAQDYQRAPVKPKRGLKIAAVMLGLTLLGFLSVKLLPWFNAGASVRMSMLQVGNVIRGDFVADVSGYANVVAARAPSLYAESTGVVQYHVEAGQSVKAGALLATIASPELASRLSQEQSALAVAMAQVQQMRIDNARAMLEKERARDQALISETSALRESERAQKAYAVKAISEIDLRRAEDTIAAAKIVRSHAERDLALEAQALALQLQNQARLSDRQKTVVGELARQSQALNLTAPFDGVVGVRALADRATVAINQPVISVVDLSAFELDLPISELYAPQLAPGLSASVEREGKRFAAELKSISPEVQNGQLMARVRFSGDVPQALKQNQRLLVRVVLDQRADALIIPRGAYLDQDRGQFVWVFASETQLVKRAVTLGAIGADQVEVLTGLKAGEKVVLSAISDVEKLQVLHVHR